MDFAIFDVFDVEIRIYQKRGRQHPKHFQQALGSGLRPAHCKSWLQIRSSWFCLWWSFNSFSFIITFIISSLCEQNLFIYSTYGVSLLSSSLFSSGEASTPAVLLSLSIGIGTKAPYCCSDHHHLCIFLTMPSLPYHHKHVLVLFNSACLSWALLWIWFGAPHQYSSSPS